MGYPRALIICLGQKMRRTKHVFVDPLWRWTIEFISTPSFVDLSLILDFSLVLAFNHLVLTTYYLAALPTSLLFVIVLDGAVLTIVVAEPQSKSHLMGSSITYSGRCFSALDYWQEISTIPAESHPEMLGRHQI